MRLRFLDTDFFDKAAENATLRYTRSILHVCGIQLQDLLDDDRSQLPEVVLAEILQPIGEKAVPEVSAALESQSRLRDKLLQNLLPFKHKNGECGQDRAPSSSIPHCLARQQQQQLPVFEFPEVDSPEEEFEIDEIFSRQREVELEGDEDFSMEVRQAAILQIQRIAFEPSVISLKGSPSRRVFLLESEEVDFFEVTASSHSGSGTEDLVENLSWDPQALLFALALQPVDLEYLEDLVVPQMYEKLVRMPLPVPDASRKQEPLEEFVLGSMTLGMLETKEVDIPQPGVREEAVTDIVDSFAMKHVELEFFENTSVIPQLYEKLVLVPELSLRCHLLMIMPVPTVCWNERQEQMEELVLGTLVSLAKCSHPSATDFIYLDWHFSEGNNCNDQRCFLFRSRHLCGVPDKISFHDTLPHQRDKEAATDFQDSKIMELSPEFVGAAAPAKLSEAHVSLELKVPDTRRQNETLTFPGRMTPPTETCTAIFVANSRLVNKHGLISRRNTYQKILSLEKEGAQVVERELRLPIDFILSPTKCLVFYSPQKLSISERGCIVEGVSACIESIIDNDMKAISFGFQHCIMVFEGDKRFITVVLQNVDDVYAAAVGLSIQVQCFVSCSPGETDSIAFKCIKEAQNNVTSIRFPRLSESATVAEAFLTESPAINPLTAHAILSSGKSLSTFISMAPAEQLAAARPFIISSHSLQLFKAQCEYKQVDRQVNWTHNTGKNRVDVFVQPVGQALSCDYGRQSGSGEQARNIDISGSGEQARNFDISGSGEQARNFHRSSSGEQSRNFHRSSGRQVARSFDREKHSQRSDNSGEPFHILRAQVDELEPFLPRPTQAAADVQCMRYFPPAAELDDEWNTEDRLTSAPCFPLAGQLDEDWDESPPLAPTPSFRNATAAAAVNGLEDDTIMKMMSTSSDFGFSTNRRNSSSSSSVKDALKSWLCAREESKKSLKKPSPPPPPPPRSSSLRDAKPTTSRKKKDSTSTVATKEAAAIKRKKPSNDILTLWENFKYRNSTAATPLLSTSKSFKRPSSSIFSSSPGEKNTTSYSVEQRGGKRTKRATL